MIDAISAESSCPPRFFLQQSQLVDLALEAHQVVPDQITQRPRGLVGQIELLASGRFQDPLYQRFARRRREIKKVAAFNWPS